MPTTVLTVTLRTVDLMPCFARRKAFTYQFKALRRDPTCCFAYKSRRVDLVTLRTCYAQRRVTA